MYLAADLILLERKAQLRHRIRLRSNNNNNNDNKRKHSSNNHSNNSNHSSNNNSNHSNYSNNGNNNNDNDSITSHISQGSDSSSHPPSEPNQIMRGWWMGGKLMIVYICMFCVVTCLVLWLDFMCTHVGGSEKHPEILKVTLFTQNDKTQCFRKFPETR